MKVTEIVPQKNNNRRVSVFVDNEYAFSLDETDAILNKVKVGTELSKSDIARLTMEGNFTKARDYAFSVISRKPVTEKMLSDKLSEKGYDKAVICEVCTELSSLGYLSDCDYANLFLEHCTQKLWGRKKIIYEMKQKGLSDETIYDCMQNFSEEDLLPEMVKTIRQKYKNFDKSDYKEKASITRYFGARGFEFSLIDKAISKASEEAENE